MTKRKMTLREFLKTPDFFPLSEGGRYVSGVMRGIPPDIEIIEENDDSDSGTGQEVS